jgi:hypothetical protein
MGLVLCRLLGNQLKLVKKDKEIWYVLKTKHDV